MTKTTKTAKTQTNDWIQWVQKAQTGDTRAFDLLVKAFQDAAVGYGAALLGDFQAGQDAAQDAFLELWRVLPDLRVPAAFPAYLRLTVRKRCDRITRRRHVPAIPLDLAFAAASPENTAHTVETREIQSRVQNVVRGLPENERVVIVLFYFAEQSLGEIADFLGLPVSTIKNRLHSARKSLRERIPSMDENENGGNGDTAGDAPLKNVVKKRRPSQSKRFRGEIIARLTGAYYKQVRDGNAPADRALIQQARDQLQAALAHNALDFQTVHAGASLLLWTQNFADLPDLMERYMAAQPLDLAETFWAKWTRIRGLAFCPDAKATVTAQNDLFHWMDENAANLSQIRLSIHDPYVPTNEANAEVLSPETLPVFALGITEVGIHFYEAGVFDKWVQRVTTTIDRIAKSNANRVWRFYALRHAAHLLALYGRFDEADGFLEQIRALAAEENDGQSRRWPIEAAILELRRYAGNPDRGEARTIAGEAARQLAAFGSQSEPNAPERDALLQTLTHNLAAPLTGSGDFDLALPLWEQIGIPSEWAALWQAECVWAVRHDRSRTLDLLRKAAAYRFDDALMRWFEGAKGFADVRNDAEFRAALSPHAK